jgi:2-methylcitrate dehydratase
MTTEIERLAEFALGVRLESLPASTLAALKRVVLDTLGCAIGAVGCEPARIAAWLDTLGEGGGRATMIGEAQPQALKRALLVNGILARYLDYGDVYWKRDVAHPSEVVPVALAAVEARGGSGRDFLEAVLAGYEAQLRLCDVFSFQAVGMHAVSSAGFASPLAIGRAWAMTKDEIAHAVALNGMRHLTLFGLVKGELSMAKALGFPLAAVEAVDACRLAQGGFTGPLGVIDWMFANLPQGLEEEQVRRMDLVHASYRTEQVSLKRFPVQFEIQGAVEAALELARALPAAASECVSEAVVTCAPTTRERTADPSKYRPANRETADHSMPCCVAMALLDGRLGAEQFEGGRWASDQVAALMVKVRVEADPDLGGRARRGRACRLTLKLVDGRELSAEVPVPLGDAQRPMSPEDMHRKFAELAAHCLSGERIAQIVEQVERLETLPRVDALTRLLRSG